MAVSVIPTLMSDISKLKKPVDIIKYVLRHYMSTPKNINDTFAGREISFRFDDAEVGHNSEAIKARVVGSLSSILSRYFPTANTIDVNVETESIDNVRYNIAIDILVMVDGAPYSISQSFAMDKEGNLIFNFDGES